MFIDGVITFLMRLAGVMFVGRTVSIRVLLVYPVPRRMLMSCVTGFHTCLRGSNLSYQPKRREPKSQWRFSQMRLR